uniref:Cytochrome c oxidase subunit 2 n=1 Tax=Choreocolax polysiphoniae TaxID=282351 RepID=A0A1J0F7A3_9FLOR|nr:cytochrome c oxidase subunit 2 [Choreocolax polysiphoniae]APC24872.1 cytochrome c oxidase subunit 2 [Choreocolax polysiphoniae]
MKVIKQLLQSIILVKWLFNFSFCDNAEMWQFGFQDSATPIMEGIINLHHDLMFFIYLILIFVTWILIRTIFFFEISKNKIASNLNHGILIEIIWTTIPAIILLIVAIPSFSLLYAMDEIVSPTITIKALGHQWYWSYEYSDYINKNYEPINFDSYMIPEEDLFLGQLRLLEVDNHLVIPIQTNIRVIVSAADVLHSWAIPSLGIKCDAIPGRLNQTSLFLKREGLYYGQCSEICGINHGFMPIVVEAVNLSNYINWLSNKINF